jgi:flagellar biosynthesis protein FliR
LLALICNVAALVVFLPAPSYDSLVASSRVALGVTCAFLACLPLVPAAQRAQVALGVAVLAMAPWFDLLPTSLGR